MLIPPTPGSGISEPDPDTLAATLGDLLSPHTRDVLQTTPPGLRAPLILGSPEFMMR